MQYEANKSGDDPVYADRNIQGLLASINSASAGASSGWVLFISVMAYFFIAMAGVSHEDFLLNSAVNQPILQVAVDLHLFFLFAPLVLVFVHFGLLIQHETLASRVRAFDHALFVYEGPENYRTHPIRRELSGYFFTQSIAGPRRSRILLTFLNLMSWFTLFLLPIVTLLAFQVAYLSYHDSDVTFWHRVYLIADIVIFIIMGTLYRFLDGGFLSGLSRDMRYHTGSFIVNNTVAFTAIFFSLFIATIPDSTLDTAMRKVWAEPVPYGWKPETPGEQPKRTAFWPTAYLFEGKIDEAQGTTESIFSRNLVITDKDLVKDKDWNKNEVTLSLRARNLSYASFDRSDLRGADFSSSIIHGARFYQTNLNSARFDKAQLVNADMREAVFAGKTSMREANLTGADLRSSRFEKLDMSLANLSGARLQEVRGTNNKDLYFKELNLEGANLTKAELQRAFLTRGNLRGANLQGANLQGAVLMNSHMQGVNLTNADLMGANLEGADLTGSILNNANLQGATLEGAHLYGVKLDRTRLKGAYMRRSKIWLVKPLSLNQLDLTDLRELVVKPAEGYFGEFGILEKIENEDVRNLVALRMGGLLNALEKEKWRGSEDFAAWIAIKDQKPNIQKVSDYFALQVCNDLTKNGYIAKAFVFRAERRYASYAGSVRYESYSPPINPESFLNQISESNCGGAKSVPPGAMYQLMKSVRRFKKLEDKVKEWREKQNN